MIKDKHQTLCLLFATDEGPEIRSLTSTESHASISLYVTDKLSCFDGHFPEQRVLPGVVQLDWVGKISQALFTELGTFQQVSNIKFKSVVFPNTSVRIELDCDITKGRVKFHLFNHKESFSTGIFKFITP